MKVRVRGCSLLFSVLVSAWLMGSSVALAQDGYAFGLHTEPATPRAGQTFTLSLSAPTCELFWAEGPLDREVAVVGTTVTVTVEYTPPAFGMGCDPATVRDVEWTLGPFPQGNYTLVLRGADPTASGVLRSIETMPLVIAAPALLTGPSVVPATDRWALVLLMLSFVGFSVRRLAKSYHCPRSSVADSHRPSSRDKRRPWLALRRAAPRL